MHNNLDFYYLVIIKEIPFLVYSENLLGNEINSFQLNAYEESQVEIELQVISDPDLFTSSSHKEGFYIKKAKISDMKSTNIRIS